MEDNEVWMDLGGDQIDQSPFLTNAANNINNYVNSKPWSAKRKNSFLNAYNAIMQTGVTGATNESGQWELTTTNPLDSSSLSNQDQEMLGTAANYILSQMQSVTPRNKEQASSNKPKIKYNGQSVFENWISNNKFGGRNDIDIATDWNVLDERDTTTGKRGVANRIGRLKNYLIEYGNSINDNDYDFEGGAFTNADDVKSKINQAVAALEGKTEVDQNIIDSLNALGLNYRKYFDDGLGENSGYQDSEGNPLTWRQYTQYQNSLLEQKAKAEEKKKINKAQQLNQAIKNSPWSKTLIHKYLNPTWNDTEFANQLGDRNLIDVLNEYASKMDQLNSGQRKFVHSAYRSGIPKVQISDEEYNILKRIQSFKGAPKSRFSKIAGVDGLIYDNYTKTLLSPTQTDENPSKDPNEWIHSQSSKVLEAQTKNISAEKRKKYLASHKDGLTSAEWEELASIGFDIASIVDPEMISSTGLALTGSGLRHHAMRQQPGGPSTSDKWWQAADYGLSILGSIPVLGDAALGARAINNLKKAIVPLGIVMAGANVPQAAKAAYNKVVKGEDLTIQDWRAIGAVLTAAIGYGRGRQMSKRAEALRRTGGTTSKSTKEGVIKTSEGEIKVPESKIKQLKEKFGKSDRETRTKVLREDVEVQKAAKEQKIDLSKAEVQGYGKFKKSPISSTTSTSNTSGNRVTTLRAMSEFNKNHGWLARKGLAEQDWIFRHTGGYESVPQEKGWFKSLWNDIRKSEWDEFGKKSTQGSTSTSQVSETSKTVEKANTRVTKRETPLSEKEAKELKENIKSWRQEYKNILNTRKNEGRNYEWSKHDVGTDKLKSSVKIGNKNINIEVGSDGILVINGEKTNINGFGPHTKDSGKRAVRQRIKETVLQAIKQEKVKKNTAEFEKTIQELRKLKAAGFLKQGGNINLDTTISNFLKNQK